MKEILKSILGTLISISDSYYLFYFTGQWGLDGEESDGEWLEFPSSVELCARHAAVMPEVRAAWDGWDGNAGWLFSNETDMPGWAYAVSSFQVQVVGESCTIIFSEGYETKAVLELSPASCRVSHVLPGRTHGRLTQFVGGLREAGIYVDSWLLDQLEPRGNPAAPWNPIYDVPVEHRVRGLSREVSTVATPRPYMDTVTTVALRYQGEVLAEYISREFRLPKPALEQVRRTEASRQRKARLASKNRRLARRLKANNKSSC